MSNQILKSYLRRLTNLSGSNRSLLLLRLISEQCIDLHLFDLEVNLPSQSIIDGLIAHQKEIPLVYEADSRSQATNKLSKKLKKLKRIEKYIFDERGAKDMYVGWPFVQGKFGDETLVRAPLIFFPTEITLQDSQWSLRLKDDVNITFNKSLILAYYFYNKKNLNEEVLEMTLNDLDRSTIEFKTQVYNILSKNSIEIDCDRQNYFSDGLSPFMDYRRTDLEFREKTGVLKLCQEAVLGIFPQAGSYLVPDYMTLIENDLINDLEGFFLSKQKTDPEDESQIRYSDRLLEENNFTPFDLDVYQEKALGLVKKGNSIIVQGPPGTGKSQLISNLICDYIARGKNVLLVCQKKAALDVVYSRLREKELHDFIGLVHDFKNDRKDIFLQISNQIDRLNEYKRKNNSLDSIELERAFQKASRKIDQIVEELDDFRKALYDKEECGKFIKELYLISNPTAPTISLFQEYKNFTYQNVDGFEDRLKQFLHYYKNLEIKQNFWVSEKSFRRWGTSEFVELQKIIDEIPKSVGEIESKALGLFNKKVDYESLFMLSENLPAVEKIFMNLGNERAHLNFIKIAKSPPKQSTEWLARQEEMLLECYKGNGFESSLKLDELGRFQEALEAAIKARRNLWRWVKWRLFSKDKIFVARVLVANNLKINKIGFETLVNKVDNRLNFEHIVSELKEFRDISDFPVGFKKTEVSNWFFFQKLAMSTYLQFSSIRPFSYLFSMKKGTRNEQLLLLKALINLLEELIAMHKDWERMLTRPQIRQIILKKISINEIKNTLQRDFDEICDYHKLKEDFFPYERKVIDDLITYDRENLNEGFVIDLFRNSLALAWIDHIEGKYPNLRLVSTQQIESQSNDLIQAIMDKKQVSGDILLHKSRERILTDLQYNRLNNLVSYRDLHHQVTKKRKIWPIRKVISSYQEDLFKLLPCWMASPESASAIFPMHDLFDLVIFDESSQCFAEKAIPALYRGKQFVIAGDRNQLKPFDLYRVRWEEGSNEDLIELEIDSLLDLANHHLMEVQLQGHYRSRYIELMDFSNKNYYKGSLKMLPIYDPAPKKPPIEYVHLKGIWENNINKVEAKEVVRQIFSIHSKDKKKTIGVITFNTKQQGFILDLIDEVVASKEIDMPKKLFVKNIENVQGDECDIIIFCTAYAPNKEGKLQLKFGSLNNIGGENRLNVAVTRARERIVLVTSILPGQLKSNESKNLGPKLFKSFLQYALDVSNGGFIPHILKEELGDSVLLRKKITEKYSSKDRYLKKKYQHTDLIISNQENDLGTILTDDEIFYNAISSKEVFAYYPHLISEKKWPNTRVFSRQYWMDREGLDKRLNKFLDIIKH